MKYEIIDHVRIYDHEDLYVHNPDTIVMPDGELIMVFRIAKRRQHTTHIDPTSRIYLMRSRDGGSTWTAPVNVYEPEPGVGLQDPSIVRLADGTLLVSYFQWRCDPGARAGQQYEGARSTEYGWSTVEGPLIIRSRDGGKSWGQPVLAGIPGQPLGTSDAVLPLPDGTLLLPAYMDDAYAIRSTDGGDSWREYAVMAHDPNRNIDFHEPALVYLGDHCVLTMIRTYDRTLPANVRVSNAAYLYQALSGDDGRTWGPYQNIGVWGHPPDLIRLAQGPLLCTYGYRRKPFGIRAVLSYDGARNWDREHEIVLRDDGGGFDVGYPSSVQLADGTIFSSYYLGPEWNDPGTRFMAATRWRLRE